MGDGLGVSGIEIFLEEGLGRLADALEQALAPFGATEPLQRKEALMATRLEHQLIDWHNRNYGEAVDVPATFRHLLEEVGELGEALMLNDQRKISEEAGDVGVLLFHVLRGACPDGPACNPASLAVAMTMALEKCIQREAIAAEDRSRTPRAGDK